ncbi:hypothetical protein NPIL_703181 [Nephila pilipes]|uniref:Uncharacterized protein n=1 Tax=Nephila pilipes TaxID=299642 RepID=A0A8X6U513_NEPPI|nr:hypothetical protein NPIL_703181 [Nephila pilipes]
MSAAKDKHAYDMIVNSERLNAWGLKRIDFKLIFVTLKTFRAAPVVQHHHFTESWQMVISNITICQFFLLKSVVVGFLGRSWFDPKDETF